MKSGDASTTGQYDEDDARTVGGGRHDDGVKGIFLLDEIHDFEHKCARRDGTTG